MKNSKKSKRFVAARLKLQQDYPSRSIPDEWFSTGRVLARGRPVLNPRARVSIATTLTIVDPPLLRGGRKLAAALDEFRVDVRGLVCSDLGASTGGFTQVLLARDARRVYAVDVGHGQLLGSLRQDARVINLERTNLANLTRKLVPDEIELATADLSYVSLDAAVNQLTDIEFSKDAYLVALIKPQFELGFGTAPTAETDLLRAVSNAATGITRAGWRCVRTVRSSHRGARGAIEFFMLGQRLLLGAGHAKVQYLAGSR